MLKVLRSPITTAILFVAAAALLLFGGINAVQAKFIDTSQIYGAQVKLTNIHTVLVENKTKLPDTNEDGKCESKLLTTMPNDLKIGKKYDYKLSVYNDAKVSEGGIAQYVRVTVQKYWVDGNGKNVELDPSLIKFDWNTDEGWRVDEDSSESEGKTKYKERTVLYYSNPLNPEQETPPLTKKLYVDPEILKKISDGPSGMGNEYNNVKLHIKATVDAVQTHSEKEAKKSAWGQDEY